MKEVDAASKRVRVDFIGYGETFHKWKAIAEDNELPLSTFEVKNIWIDHHDNLLNRRWNVRVENTVFVFIGNLLSLDDFIPVGDKFLLYKH